MPIYPYNCLECGNYVEKLAPIGSPAPDCCGKPMIRNYGIDSVRIKIGPPLWTDRMDEIHKKQADKGERLRFVHPSEIGAN